MYFRAGTYFDDTSYRYYFWYYMNGVVRWQGHDVCQEWEDALVHTMWEAGVHL